MLTKLKLSGWKGMLSATLLTALAGVASAQASATQTTAAVTQATQFSVLNIPALPPGGRAPTPAAPAQVAQPQATPEWPTTLPTGKVPLAESYAVSLTGPQTVQAGEAQTWSFNLSNMGLSPIHLEYGACDVRFEVLDAAGQVVRPDPRGSLCTMQLVILDVLSGESAEVQKIRWDGKDGSGQPVPAGTYTLRARMVSGERFSPPATWSVRVE